MPSGNRGGIKPSKSFWYLIDHKWTGSKWIYQTKLDAPGEVTIRAPDSEERVTLQRYEPHESQETLGIALAMDGNQKGERELLRQRAEEFADKLRTAPGLKPNDAWEAVLTQIMATFKYPAAATQLTEDDWTYICAPVFKAGLPKAGISRMFPHASLYGPLLFQGMGLLHPFHNQELEHLSVILKHCTDDTLTGQLIQQS